MDSIAFLTTKLEEKGSTIKVLSDSGWGKGISDGRCLQKFTRIINFEKELSKDELGKIKRILEEDKKCPGWTGISSSNNGHGSYEFLTIWDSSD